MSIKIIKVTRDLNVGITTVVDFLRSKGYQVESNPNVKITDEQYILLVKELGKDLSPAEQKQLLSKLASPAAPPPPPAVEKKPEAPQKTQEIKTEIPDEIKPKFVTIGKIDLTSLDTKPEGSSSRPHSPKTAAREPVGARRKESPYEVKQTKPVKQEPVKAVEQEPAKPVKPEPVKMVKQEPTKPEPAKAVKQEPAKPVKPEPAKMEKNQPPVPKVQEERKTPVVPEKKEEKPPVQAPPVVKHPKPEQPAAEKKKGEDKKKPEQPVPVPQPVEQPVKPSIGKPKPPVPAAVPEKQKEAKPATDVKPPKKEGEEEVFRLNQTPGPSIKVTGKIDLSAINQSTRPKKKREERRRKERGERRRAAAAAAAAKTQPAAGVATTATAAGSTPAKEDAGKKKRKRIKPDRVDINATQGSNVRSNRTEVRKPQQHRLRKPVKAEVSEEDVQKQIKETLARLTSKSSKSSKGAKYRRDKRDAAEKREQELQMREERESKVLKLTEFVTANDLASMMNVSVSEVISTCMSIGMMVAINQRLDAETINIVADEFGFKTEYVSAEMAETIQEEEDHPEDYVPRPPIVTVMGHVDHGKTSLLDNIRNANVIASEAGGITQHIGAYNVKLANGRRITFLDTPGHEAFTAMRARGAKVTDIVIIIIAADDSVMPQTVEAINHASVAGVSIVFAINKIDKPGANPEKIKEELAKMNYLVEDWGGKYQTQEISAKKGIGVQELLEKVLLEADLMELKANPNKRAVASVIESSLDKGRGYVATILVSNGTLRQGDVVLAGTHYGRVKAMFNERNQRVEKAGPSEPVLILGLDGAPQAGDTLNVLETEQEAREIAARREQLQRELGLRTQKRFGLEELGRRRALGDFHELHLIVKGDVDGSVEALSDSLIKLSTEEIQVNVIHKAVGQISESDIDLAASVDAVIIGFQVRPAPTARRRAEKEGVEIRLYSVIYDAIEEVKSAMIGMLSPEIREEIAGNVEVLEVFKISKVGTVAGCMVKEGKIKRTNKVRIIRDGIVIHAGELGSLKRFKDEVKEVVTGQECGIFITNCNNIQIGDTIEAFDQIEIKKTL
ncbi:MAG: translation initiation factor IF-2 [Tannerella sp.]|jgi:translation initiation factor IF-2|nr:translation initiation factor IF-2 [Tannerella sp.]